MRPERRCGRSRRGGVAWLLCQHRAARVPRRYLERGRSRRTDRRSHSAGRPAGAAAIRASPIAGRGRSSGRCARRLYMKVWLSTRLQHCLSRCVMVLPHVVGSGQISLQQRLYHLTCGRAPLVPHHNASWISSSPGEMRPTWNAAAWLPMTKTVAFPATRGSVLPAAISL